MNTGTMQFGRPSMGAWVLYGLGSETKDLPGFVVFSSGSKGPSGGDSCWGSGFLPTMYQGVQFRSAGDPVLYLSNPPGVDTELQRDSLDALKQLNQMRAGITGDPEIATRITSFEMAFRMQSAAPDLMDIGKEPKEVLEMYGAEPGKASFANNCLLARRLVEKGVRFVQLYHEAWDQHSSGADGRDHHPNAFTMWMAGGGIKAGARIGETDDLGFNVVKDQVHVHDLHATMLRLLGYDHTRLTYKFQGRPFRLTDVHGNVVDTLIA
jgi:hypothetical protein